MNKTTIDVNDPNIHWLQPRSKTTPTPQATATPSPTPTPQGNTQYFDGFVAGTPKQYQDIIKQAATQHGIKTSVLSSLLSHESMGFNPDVISGKLNSPVGAQGIGQFMPATAQGLGINPLDPAQAIPASAKYIADKMKQHGSIELALAAYNAGSGNVNKYGGIPPFPETQNYVKNILNSAKQTYDAPIDTPTPTPSAIPSATPTPEQLMPVKTKYHVGGQVAGASTVQGTYPKTYAPTDPNKFVYHGNLSPEEVNGVERGMSGVSPNTTQFSFLGGSPAFAAEIDPKKKRAAGY